MGAYTPGPWETDCADHDCPHQDIAIRAVGNRNICRVWIDDAPVPEYNREQEANARLIAAAPELLEMCRLLVADDLTAEQLCNRISAAKRVIAKAAQP